MIELETERLVLRPWRLDDLDALAQFYDQPDDLGLKFIGGPVKRDIAWRIMCVRVGMWQLRGYGIFAVVEKASREWVGHCGLMHHVDKDETGPNLAYSIKINRRGRGFATEAADRVARYTFDKLLHPSVVTYIDPDNGASRRVVEKLGAAKTGMININDTPTEIWCVPDRTSISRI
jgi:RimJ/RimL family protein N-acetyltransferase